MQIEMIKKMNNSLPTINYQVGISINPVNRPTTANNTKPQLIKNMIKQIQQIERIH